MPEAVNALPSRLVALLLSKKHARERFCPAAAHDAARLEFEWLADHHPLRYTTIVTNCNKVAGVADAAGEGQIEQVKRPCYAPVELGDSP